jgi:predicted GH43/DUF377 family glycosyl hydrolase
VQAGELVVETTFKPEGCDEGRKTKSGDHLYMHYTVCSHIHMQNTTLICSQLCPHLYTY